MIPFLSFYREVASERLAHDPNALSDRELQILRLTADGKGAKETARIVGIMESTVKVHKKALYRKLCAKNCAHAIAIGFRRGLLS